MRLRSNFLLALLLGDVYSWVPESTVATDLEASKSLAKLLDTLDRGDFKKHLATKGVEQKCQPSQVSVRREYSTLSREEKIDYIDAVNCLYAAPSKIPPGLAPGAKNRYDDFVATHVNQSDFIHLAGPFFAWHRYYVWSFEKALREECGYKGYLPYWNWGKSAKDPLNSPYMDGSPTSQGGNGLWSPHSGICPLEPLGGPYCTPVVQGQGGGCVTSGPYANLSTNIAPTAPGLIAPDAPLIGAKLSYQPRCVRRDISQDLTSKFAKDDRLLHILTHPIFQGDTIGPFQDFFEAGIGLFPAGSPDDDIGLHAAGHYAYAGDPGADFYNSPGDPLFWLHHSMVDRTWWIWQNQKPVERVWLLHGTRTMNNMPPSGNATLEDIVDMGFVTPKDGPTYEMKHHMSSVAGPYCYIYQ